MSAKQNNQQPSPPTIGSYNYKQKTEHEGYSGGRYFKRNNDLYQQTRLIEDYTNEHDYEKRGAKIYMTSPKQQVEKTGINNKTLILNPWHNLVDTTELKNNLKNCSCGKTIAVEVINCSCNKFLEVGLREYNQPQSNDQSILTLDHLAAIKASMAKKQTDNSPKNSITSEASIENCGDGRLAFLPNEHALTVIKKNSETDSQTYIQTGGDVKYHDLKEVIHQNDLKTKPKKLKVFLNIQQPKFDNSKHGPVTKIDFKMNKDLESFGMNDMEQHMINLNKNVNANASESDSKRNKTADKVSVKRQEESRYKQIETKPVESACSVEDFQSIKDDGDDDSNDSSEDLHRNNNAKNSTASVDDVNIGNLSIGQKANQSPKQMTIGKTFSSPPQQKVPTSSTPHKERAKSMEQEEEDERFNQSNIIHSPPDNNSVTQQVGEEKPQKLTLNAQIKLKIYQNENGEIAVQQEPASRIDSGLEVNTNLISSRTHISAQEVRQESHLKINNKISETSFIQTFNPTNQAQRLDELEKEGYTINRATGFGIKNNVINNSNNNNNSNYLCGTKNLYIKQKKLSSINNNILYYEEKEMQMSETSTIISEQDMQEYNNNSYFNKSPQYIQYERRKQ